jgi:hypothetical protein
MTLSIITHLCMTLSITVLSIMALSITIICKMEQHNSILKVTLYNDTHPVN